LISRDPLTNLYNRAVVTYMLMLFVALLWPFDFAFQRETNNVHWITKSNGIEFRQRGQILSRSSTENLCGRLLIPKLSDFLLDLRRSLEHKGFAKILDISAGMPAVFANPYASRSQHISSQKIAQLRL